MVKSDRNDSNDSDNVNPFILDEKTRYSVKVQNFKLGEGKYRDLQDRHHERMERVKRIAKQLNVNYNPVLEDPDNIIKRTELITKYYNNKEQYDSVMQKILSVYTPEEVLDILKKHITKS